MLPALATLPSAFSTMLARPPRLLPGVVLALRSAAPRGQIFVVPAHLADQVARHIRRRGARRQQVDASRTSVTSENITVAPARTSRSAA